MFLYAVNCMLFEWTLVRVSIVILIITVLICNYGNHGGTKMRPLYTCTSVSLT